MRRSSSVDRVSLGPLRVRNDDNRPASQSRRGRSSSAGKGGRSFGGKMSIGGRPSLSDNRPSTSRSSMSKSGIPQSKFGHQQRLSRGGNMGKSGIPKDPRPVSDKSYQHKMIKTLQEFLTMRGYPHNITPKMLQSPTSKDFFRIFEFIYSFVAPKFKLTDKHKPEEEIPRLLKQLGYPFLISKTSLYSIGSPHTWPNLLAALNFLIEFVNYAMSIESSVEEMIFPPDDDVFDSTSSVGESENHIQYKYFLSGYAKFMDGHDDYEDIDIHLRKKLREKLFGVGDIESLMEEANTLEQQLEFLEQSPDRLKTAQQKIESLENDEERLKINIQELESQKRQLEHECTEYDNTISSLEVELDTRKSKITQMQLIFENQEFTPADVERINMRQQELLRETREYEKITQTLDEDIWKEEIALSKEVEEIESKFLAYNNMAHGLKLIPITAENSSGIDYELKKSVYTAGSQKSTFTNVIKPALLTMKSQCNESVSQLESEKFRVMGEVELASDAVCDLENDVLMMESKLKRLENDMEFKKQMFRNETQQMQEKNEEVENELLQLNNDMVYSQQDEKSDVRKLTTTYKQEVEKCERKLEKYKTFFKDALETITDHLETMQGYTERAVEYSKEVRKEAEKEAAKSLKE
ncbi:kinetochore-associated Ndc80 complex subunit ndc80 [Mactra antiquata]